MMRPRRVASIATFEFLQTVRRLSYVIVTFGLPIFLGGLTTGIAAIQGEIIQERLEQTVSYALVDEAGLLEDSLWSPRESLDPLAQVVTREAGADDRFLQLDSIVLWRAADLEAAVALAQRRSVGAIYRIDADWLQTGAVHVYDPADSPVVNLSNATIEPVLRRLLVDRLLIDEVRPEVLDRVREPMSLTHLVIEADGTVREPDDRGLEIFVRIAVPFFLGVLLLTALLSASGYLVQTISQDKESHIVEVLLSSTSPDELLAGKLLGLGGAGLLQFAVWSAMVVTGALGLAAMAESLDVTVPWTAIIVAPIFFVLGYLFIGGLMLVTASLGANAAEAQKLSIGWALLGVIPLMMISVLLDQPHGVIAHMLTWIPFSAPLTIIVRLSLDPTNIHWYEMVGAGAGMILATYAVLRGGAGIFRVGLLLSGSRPPLREILRQLRG